MGDCFGDDTLLVLLDETGAEVNFHDDIDYPNNKCALIAGQAITGGTIYYIGAFVYSFSASNDYTLTVTAQ
jgi:hypothetical protein